MLTANCYQHDPDASNDVRACGGMLHSDAPVRTWPRRAVRGSSAAPRAGRRVAGRHRRHPRGARRFRQPGAGGNVRIRGPRPDRGLVDSRFDRARGAGRDDGAVAAPQRRRGGPDGLPDPRATRGRLELRAGGQQHERHARRRALDVRRAARRRTRERRAPRRAARRGLLPRRLRGKHRGQAARRPGDRPHRRREPSRCAVLRMAPRRAAHDAHQRHQHAHARGGEGGDGQRAHGQAPLLPLPPPHRRRQGPPRRGALRPRPRRRRAALVLGHPGRDGPERARGAAAPLATSRDRRAARRRRRPRLQQPAHGDAHRGRAGATRLARRVVARPARRRPRARGPPRRGSRRAICSPSAAGNASRRRWSISIGYFRRCRGCCSARSAARSRWRRGWPRSCRWSAPIPGKSSTW